MAIRKLRDAGIVSGVQSSYDARRVGTTVGSFITATGGDSTADDGDYKVHSFTSSGTFEVTELGSDGTYGAKVWLLLVGGGGGGGSNSAVGGGGGGGGYYDSADYNIEVEVGKYTVTVGDGGAADAMGADSVFGTIIVGGGGAGADSDMTISGPENGASGGGASRNANEGPANIASGGSPNGRGSGSLGGGAASTASDEQHGGGGGSPMEKGGFAESGVGGHGADGIASSITGASVTRAGGGGGKGLKGSTADNGDGGSGGGGNAGAVGTANTGGGGGGQYAGGSGIVIVRYKFQ